MRYIDTVKRSFSRAAATYEGASALQKEVADMVAIRLIALMGAAKRLSVLDVGCGTGSLAAIIKSVDMRISVTGIDVALPMLAEARRLNANVSIAACRGESIAFAGASFDGVASSLAYQWSSDLSASFSESARVLKPGGAFVFGTLGPSTLNELKSSFKGFFKDPFAPDFPDIDSIRARLASAGFELLSIERRPMIRRYGSLRELLNVLKDIGALPPRKGSKRGLMGKGVLRDAGELYARDFPWPDGSGIRATYDVIIAAGRKAG